MINDDIFMFMVARLGHYFFLCPGCERIFDARDPTDYEELNDGHILRCENHL